MQLPPEVGYWEPRIVVTLVACILVLPVLIVFIGCIARAGLSAIWIAIAWGVVIAATGIGLFYYSRVQHDLWAGELQ